MLKNDFIIILTVTLIFDRWENLIFNLNLKILTFKNMKFLFFKMLYAVFTPTKYKPIIIEVDRTTLEYTLSLVFHFLKPIRGYKTRHGEIRTISLLAGAERK